MNVRSIFFVIKVFGVKVFHLVIMSFWILFRKDYVLVVVMIKLSCNECKCVDAHCRTCKHSFKGNEVGVPVVHFV